MKRKLSGPGTVVAWVALAALSAPRCPGSPLPAITGYELGEPRPQAGFPGIPVAASSDATLGWSFTLSVPVDVLSLGFFDVGGDGLNEPHLVGIWDSDGEMVISAGINRGTSNPLAGAYRYAQVQPTRLLAGRAYVIGATVPLGQFVTPLPEDPGEALDMDLYPYHNVIPHTIALDSHVSLDANALAFPGSAGPIGTPGPGQLNLPLERNVDGYYFAANFRFDVVPEPVAMLLVTVSAVPILGRRLSRQRGRSTSRGEGTRHDPECQAVG
jgi:hypothetical protein